MIGANAQADGADAGRLNSRLSHVLLLFVISVACLFYFGYSQSASREEIPNVGAADPQVIKIRPNLEDAPIFYHNKIYVHPSLTVPQVATKLLNEVTLHIESSTYADVGSDHALSWAFKDDARIHFRPFKTRFGLLGISACRVERPGPDADRNFVYFGLLRADRKLCEAHAASSWTCQKDHDYFNTAFDSRFCVLVVRSSRLTDILQFVHDFMATQDIPKSGLDVGMFCGNPLIARSANTEKDLYFINLNAQPEANTNSFFVCKFSTMLKDVTECYNTEIIAKKVGMPLVLIHDPGAGVLMTANYAAEDNNLSFLTFRTSRLAFKAAFRSIPSPSGWIISLGTNSKGKVFFAGDSAPYELLGIYDLASSKEKYHNLYL